MGPGAMGGACQLTAPYHHSSHNLCRCVSLLSLHVRVMCRRLGLQNTCGRGGICFELEGPLMAGAISDGRCVGTWPCVGGQLGSTTCMCSSCIGGKKRAKGKGW